MTNSNTKMVTTLCSHHVWIYNVCVKYIFSKHPMPVLGKVGGRARTLRGDKFCLKTDLKHQEQMTSGHTWF